MLAIATVACCVLSHRCQQFLSRDLVSGRAVNNGGNGHIVWSSLVDQVRAFAGDYTSCDDAGHPGICRHIQSDQKLKVMKNPIGNISIARGFVARFWITAFRRKAGSRTSLQQSRADFTDELCSPGSHKR